ncbi:MAG: hypothetical protein WBQ75_19350 [Acetobacteraceae bacterium]
MAYAFDTLGYAKRLRGAGMPAEQAEGHAEAAREFIMAELVTRSDLEVSERATRTALETARRELENAIAGVRHDLENAIAGVRHDLEHAIASLRRDLEGAIERQTLRMTVRLGGMIAIAVAILAGIVKL